MLTMLVLFVVVILVAGFVVWAIDRAPMIDPTFKAFARWAVIVVAGVLAIYFLLALLGVVAGPVPGAAGLHLHGCP